MLYTRMRRLHRKGNALPRDGPARCLKLARVGRLVRLNRARKSCHPRVQVHVCQRIGQRRCAPAVQNGQSDIWPERQEGALSSGGVSTTGKTVGLRDATFSSEGLKFMKEGLDPNHADAWNDGEF